MSMKLKKQAKRIANKGLRPFGLKVVRAPSYPAEFVEKYRKDLVRLKERTELNVFEFFRYSAGDHPKDSTEHECEFVADSLSRLPSDIKILDVGSHRQFISGLLAHFDVTTIDVRKRTSHMKNETVITCDAKKLEIPDNAFDVVTSICSLEHFGLGRYGDEIDLDADKKAFNEMVRVLKPGGSLIFTTIITRARPSLGFNAARIYSRDMIKGFCKDMHCVREAFYSNSLKRLCSFEEITTEPKAMDTYCGCYIKQ